MNYIAKWGKKNLSMVIPSEYAIMGTMQYSHMLIIHIGTNATSLIHKKRNRLQYSNDFPLGISHLVEKIKLSHPKLSRFELLNNIQNPDFAMERDKF